MDIDGTHQRRIGEAEIDRPRIGSTFQSSSWPAS